MSTGRTLPTGVGAPILLDGLKITGRVRPLQVIHRFQALLDRGGGRNTDEGFHISGGAIVAGAIAAGVGAFIAQKLGALGE
mgnify:CR=1 FL=1